MKFIIRIMVSVLLIFLMLSIPVSAVDGLTSSVAETYINFNWSYNASFDYVNVSELEEGAPFIDLPIILDGLEDAVYDLYAHGYVFDSPNPLSNLNFETVLWYRNSTHLIGYADGFDADALPQDDRFKLGLDILADGLTADDKLYTLKENGQVTVAYWSGSSWSPTSTTATGVVVGAGGGGAISYEMIIPLTELSGFVTGQDIKFMMERAHTGSNPDVQSFYPTSLTNETNSAVWANATLEESDIYHFLGVSTDPHFNSTGLTPYTWFKHRFDAVNNSAIISTNYSTDITLDVPHYFASGYVHDESGNPIVNVSVHSHNGVIGESTLTNESGYWIGFNFKAANYTIHGQKTGYHDDELDIIVTGNSTNNNLTLTIYNNAELYVKLLEIEELLTVVETAPTEIIKMTYQIFLMLIFIDVLLVWYSFTHTDVSYYTDIITSLMAMIMSILLAYNSVIGVSYYYATQSTVHEIVYTSVPLMAIFVTLALVMMIFFVTKILEINHMEMNKI